MIVVSDTTPLISLLKIHRLNLLEQLFGDVQIPPAVFSELTANPNFQTEADEIRSCSFIKISPVDAMKVSRLQNETGLDLGETEAIVLSESINANLTLIDEANARAVARQRGIEMTGTVGILSRAFSQNLVTANEVRECVEVFRESGRYISKILIDNLLAEAK